MAEPEPLGNSSHSSGDMPYAKRCRREPASNSKATLKGWWQQKSYRSSDGRFVSKKDTAAAIAQEVKATHEMERRAWAAPYFPPVRSTDGVIVGVATEPVPAQTTSVWLGKKLERSKAPADQWRPRWPQLSGPRVPQPCGSPESLVGSPPTSSWWALETPSGG